VAAGAVANLVLSGKIENQSGGLRGGKNLSVLLKTIPEAPEVLVRMCVIGERSGKLGPALTDAAGILERSARTRTDSLMSALTPAITLLLGLVVALVIGALLLGLASLTEIDI
jgi:general secretion pathway protein F